MTVEVGRAKITIRDLLRLNEGSVIELDRLAGDPLDILINGTMIAKGEEVYALAGGEPEVDTPDFIKQAAIQALNEGRTKYTPAGGIPELREAIAGFYRSQYQLDIDPQRILVTPGGSGGLLLASSLLVDPDKHWLLADPGYPFNRHFLRLVEGD